LRSDATSLLNKAEWAAALILLLCSIAAQIRWSILAALAIVAGLLADTFWLLPSLDARVVSIMRGSWPEPSILHHIYIALDGTKFALLIAIAADSARRIPSGQN
jgi:hypothetical protein